MRSALAASRFNRCANFRETAENENDRLSVFRIPMRFYTKPTSSDNGLGFRLVKTN